MHHYTGKVIWDKKYKNKENMICGFRPLRSLKIGRGILNEEFRYITPS